MHPPATRAVLCADLVLHYAVKTHHGGGVRLGQTRVTADLEIRQLQYGLLGRFFLFFVTLIILWLL